MAYSGKWWFYVCVAAFSTLVTSFLFKMNWIWWGIHCCTMILSLKMMAKRLFQFKQEFEVVCHLYEMMMACVIEYRQHKQIMNVAHLLVDDFGVVLNADYEQGNVSFNLLRSVHTHYLWQSVIGLIEIDVIQGDPHSVRQLYDLEEDIDTWFQTVNHYVNDLYTHVKTLIFLVVFSIFIAWMVMNMLHAVIALYLTPIYQWVVGVFIILVQCIFAMICGAFKRSLILEVECVL